MSEQNYRFGLSMIAILVFEYFDSRQLEKYLMVFYFQSHFIVFNDWELLTIRVGYFERTQTNQGVCILCLKGNCVTSMKHGFRHDTEHDTYTDTSTQLIIWKKIT